MSNNLPDGVVAPPETSEGKARNASMAFETLLPRMAVLSLGELAVVEALINDLMHKRSQHPVELEGHDG